MARSIIKKHHVALDFSLLKDSDRSDLVAGIQKVAPLSQVFMNSPAMQASFAALVTKCGVLQQCNAAVAADKQKLRSDTDAETTTRGALDGEISVFAALAEANALSPGDLSAVGLDYRPPAATKTLAPVPPESIDVTFPKTGHGKATASAHETGKTRRKYAAQWSPDPMGPNTWLTLFGTGKSRTLTGKSGDRVWVRFATVRGEAQSEWCTPVLVTIP